MHACPGLLFCIGGSDDSTRLSWSQTPIANLRFGRIRSGCWQLGQVASLDAPPNATQQQRPGAIRINSCQFTPREMDYENHALVNRVTFNFALRTICSPT